MMKGSRQGRSSDRTHPQLISKGKPGLDVPPAWARSGVARRARQRTVAAMAAQAKNRFDISVASVLLIERRLAVARSPRLLTPSEDPDDLMRRVRRFWRAAILGGPSSLLAPSSPRPRPRPTAA